MRQIHLLVTMGNRLAIIIQIQRSLRATHNTSRSVTYSPLSVHCTCTDTARNHAAMAVCCTYLLPFFHRLIVSLMLHNNSHCLQIGARAQQRHDHGIVVVEVDAATLLRRKDQLIDPSFLARQGRHIHSAHVECISPNFHQVCFDMGLLLDCARAE